MDVEVVNTAQVLRGYFNQDTGCAPRTPEAKLAEARRQLAAAKASLDSTLNAVLIDCPAALDAAYVQQMAAMLMKAHKAAREAAGPLQA